MSAQSPKPHNPSPQPTPQERPRVTLGELRKKAEDVRNLAVSEAKAQVDEVKSDKLPTLLLIGTAAVIGVMSLAYFIGSNAGRSAAERQFDRIIHDPCGPFGPFGKDVDRY